MTVEAASGGWCSRLDQFNIGSFPDLISLKGVKIKVRVPVAANVPVGTNFKITATVGSDNHTNPKNATRGQPEPGVIKSW